MPLVAPLEPHRSRYRAGFGTLAATPGCRVIIGPVPSHHSRCNDYVTYLFSVGFSFDKLSKYVVNFYHISMGFVNDLQKTAL